MTMNYEAASYRPLLAVADILGEGEKVVVELVGLVALSSLMKKAFMSLNFAARELFGSTVAP